MESTKIKINNNKLKWKPVNVEGTLGGEDFEGFAGLEVLEGYDSSVLAGNKRRKRDFAISDLDGDILSGNEKGVKRQKEDDDDEKDEEELLPKKKKKKKAKNQAPSDSNQNFPGKFVLLNQPSLTEEAENFFADPEKSAIRSTWYDIGIVSDEIIRALVELKFTTPTEIQRLSIPSASHKCDILGAAETGSGKTLAFGLPLIQSIQKELIDDEDKKENLFSLILTPTRELASQITKHLKAVAKYTNVSIACIIGGLAQVKQERVLNSHPHIVIGTPGRVWELIETGNEHLQKLMSLKYLVIDETDRMIEKGHFAELEQILDTVNNDQENTKRQTFVFSATLTMTHDLPEYITKKKKKLIRPKEMTKEQRADTFISLFGMRNPKIFDITNQAGVASKLVESRILCSLDEKDYYLYYILITFRGRTIVFCNSIDCVKRAVSVLNHLNISSIPLHGHMEQKQRLKNVERFQKKEDAIMIATNCAARGLDIPNIQHVIHYQVPITGEDYVHRSGRTARASKEGLSILIIETNEVKNFVKLQKTLGRNEDLPIFPTDAKVMRIVRERVRLARDIESLDLQQRRAIDNKSWKKKAADDIGILDSDDSDNEEGKSSTNRDLKQMTLAIKHKKAALGKMLATSIISSNIQSLKYPIGPQINESIETNPIMLIKKSSMNGAKKSKGMKLFKKRK